ncbi:phosphonate metabolism protein [alpha proteobacterium BAL199]|jgi:alpha-D-ribose 1-methylphosphonate 5-triphosphate synthase subunit PhnG|nr:phosphonate metabolism protein [alpha proteobacterium BAL199]
MPTEHSSAATPEQSAERRARQRWMSILAKAEFSDLDTLWNNLPSKPTWTVVRLPEIGMVMARGRAGGTGQRFNLGEVAVTRCAVQLEFGAVGFGYVMGRNRRHAELAAAVDAMLQTPSRRDALERAIIAPLTLRLDEKRLNRSRKAAATKVEFFTMVRGS